MPLTIDAINRLDGPAFVAAFGDVAEHAPWVAKEAARHRPFADREAMIAAFAGAVRRASGNRRLALLNAHPDLAGRAALAGEMTGDSVREQAGAGLDALTADEMARFTDLNGRYRATFGIPFIYAVRGATKHDILAAFEARIGRAPADEIAAAVEQVARIMRFRLEDRVRA